MKLQRYLIIVDTAPVASADSANDQLSATMSRQGLEVAKRSPLLTIFASPRCLSIAAWAGAPAILGTLFEQPGGSAAVEWPQRTGEAVGDSATAFVEAYWGGYLAIWDRPVDRRVTALRDPSGALPCYYMRRGDRTYLASDIAIMADAGIVTPTIDWQQLTQHLIAIQYRTARTSLGGVTELSPGTALTLTPGSSQVREIWSPWTFARRDRFISDRREAVARVREMVERVVQSWASVVAHPVLSISGGLDSSIVAAALRAAHANFDCLTLATTSPAGDERAEARLMAALVDAPLHERHFDVAEIDLRRSAAAHLPRPTARAFGQEMDRFSLEVAADVGADCFFHGGGGDNVFCYLQSVAPILDSLAVRGIRRSWATLGDVGRLTETDVPTVGRETARRLWSRRRDYRWAVDTRLLSESAIEDAESRFDHPWLVVGSDALAGSAAHIANLLAIQNYLEGYRRERALPVIAPLLSQPLVELCLQVPSWLWVSNGINRAVARDAFADLLPPTLYRRRSKGTPDSVTTELLEANRPLIREMLLGGMLASERILDKAAIETILRDRRPATSETASRILTFCDAEAWARSVGRDTGTAD